MPREPYLPKGPFDQIALAPTLAGLALMLLGILMIAYWHAVIVFLEFVAVLALGLAVCVVGFGFLLVGLDLWRGVSFLRRNVRIGRWRIWPEDRE